VNLGGSYRFSARLRVLAHLDNVLDQTYYTSAQLGPAGFTDAVTFVARPFPAVNGEFPVRRTTFYAPGAPRRGWLGVRLTF
jgi:outer membrane receptor protein involved in Fe transport